MSRKEILAASVFRATYEGKPDIVEYLLDQRSASMDGLSPSLISTPRSAEMF